MYKKRPSNLYNLKLNKKIIFFRGNIYKMGFLCYLVRTFKRVFLYQALIIFAVFRLLKAFKFYRDFERRTIEMVTLFHLPESVVFWKDVDTPAKEWIYKGFLIGLIVLSSFSILGVKFFQFLAGIFSIIIGFLYYNPIKYYKEKEIKTTQDYFPQFEFILYATLGLGMIAQSFQRCCCQKAQEEKDVKIELPKTTDRSGNSNSSGKKKRE